MLAELERATDPRFKEIYPRLVGGGHARVWTCDLTHGYISINADYRS